MNDSDISVEVTDLGKDFGSVRALDQVTFSVAAGSYFVLLGPSGGGKTTTLRLIGGFERPSRGSIRLLGHDVTDLPPNRRGASMVFQSFALFPHMTVERNVAYGLRLQKRPRKEITERVAHMLEMVGLEGLGRRMPNALSGGQQQRVQLARSLVLDSQILLLDEPLAALDAKLRKDMCLELKHIQERVGITFIHVTHNQEEAMTIADRIAVIADGNLVEEDTPENIYLRPRARFTANFIGENNLLSGSAMKPNGDRLGIDLGVGAIHVPSRGMAVSTNQPVTVSIRSEKMRIRKSPEASDGVQSLPAIFEEQVYLGLTTNVLVHLEDGRQLLLRSLGDTEGFGLGENIQPGSKVYVCWNFEDGLLHVD